MALNFSGIGIALTVKDQGFDPAIRKSINSMTKFKDGFNEAVNSLGPLQKSTKGLVEELEQMSQLKVNELFEKGISGKILKKDLDDSISSLNKVTYQVNELKEGFAQGEINQQDFAEGLDQIVAKFQLANVQGAKFSDVMSLNSDQLEEASRVLTSSKFRMENFKKSLSETHEQYKKGNLTIYEYGRSIIKSLPQINSAKDAIMLFGRGILTFGKNILSFVGSAGFGAFTLIMGSWLDIFTSLGKTILSTSYTFVSKFVPSLGSVGTAVNKLKDIVVGLGKTFIDVTLGGMNLTTGFEARLVALDKEASRIGANFGLTGTALRKFSGQASSMAISLNMSATETGEAIKAWSRASDQFKTIGIKSATDVAKLINVSGASAEGLSTTLRTLSTNFGITGQNLDQLIGTWTQFGKETGDVGKGLTSVQDLMSTLQERAALMGAKLDSKQLANYGAQTASLARAFFALTGNQDQALESAKKFAVNMVESRKSFQNMFAGTEATFNKTLLSVGVAAGDINVSLKSMKQGPAEFLASLAHMAVKNKDILKGNSQAFNFMRGQIEAAFGDMAPIIMKALSSADESLLKTLAATANTTDSLSKLAKEGYKTGYTLADRFNLMSDRFVMGFRNIGRSAATDFVAKADGEFKKLNATLSSLAADENSLMGKAIKKMSEIHSLGALALIPETLRPMAAAFGTLAKQIMPTVEALGSFGISISDIFSPTGLIMASMGGMTMWFMSLRAGGKTTTETLETMTNEITSFLESIPELIDKGLAWLDSFFDELDSGLDSTLGGINWSDKWEKLFTAASKAISKIGNVLSKLVNSVWDGVTGAFDPNKSEGKSGIERIGNQIGATIRKAWDWAVNFIKVEVWPRIQAFGHGVFDRMKDTVDVKKGGYAGAYDIGQTIGDALVWIWEKVVVPGAKYLWNEIGNFFSGFWTTLWGGVVNAEDKSTTFGTQLGGMVGEGLNAALDMAWKAVLDVINANKEYTFIMAVLAGAFGGGAIGLPVIGALAGAVFGGIFMAYASSESQKNLANGMANTVLESLDMATKEIKNAGETSKVKLNKVVGDILAAGSGKELGMLQAGEIGNVGSMLNAAISGPDKGDIVKGISQRVDLMMETLGEQLEEAKATGDTKLEQVLGERAAHTKIFLANIDQMVTAYSTANKVTNAEALKVLTDSMMAGTFTAQGFALKAQGFLKDLNTTVKTEGQQTAQLTTDNLKNSLDSITGFGKDALGTAQKAWADVKGFFDSKKPEARKAGKKTYIEGMTEDEKRKFMQDPTLKKAFADMAKNLDAPVRKTIEEVLTIAFDNAYKKVQAGTKSFTSDLMKMEGGFESLVDNIKELFKSMWETITTNIQDSINLIKTSIGDVSKDLSSLVSVMETVDYGKSIVTNYEESKTMQSPKQLPSGMTTDEAIYDAIHNPDWYFDYRQIFKTEIAALRADIRGLTPASGSKTPTKKGEPRGMVNLQDKTSR